MLPLSPESLLQIQGLLLQWSECVFMGHLRTHTHLPGPPSERNHMTNRFTQFIAVSQELTIARSLHKCFHLRTVSLRFHTGITTEQVV